MACNPNYDLYPSTPEAEAGDSEARLIFRTELEGVGEGCLY